MNNKFDARQYIIKTLGEKNEQRIKDELALMNDKNCMEVFYAHKISQFLHENNQYYIIRGVYSNLKINYLLNITNSDPSDLPYEFLLLKDNESLIYEFNVASSFKQKLLDYINDISHGVMAITNNGCLIPFTDEPIKLEEYENKSEKLIKINILSLSGLDKLNENIRKYGLPEYDIRYDERINSMIFDKQNVDGITGIDVNALTKLLKQCDESEKNFSTYVYLTAVLHTNVISQIVDLPITKDNIKKHPCTREGLYALLIESKIDKQTALQICEYTRKGRKYRANNKTKWEELTNNITVSLRRYLDNIDGLFPLAHCISFAKLNYLEIFYKLMNERSNESKTENDDFKEELGHNIKKRDEYLTEYQEIWKSIKLLIKNEINNSTYEECFKHSKVVDFDKDLVFVEVESTLIKFKIQQVYYNLIKSAQRKITNKLIKFRFVEKYNCFMRGR